MGGLRLFAIFTVVCPLLCGAECRTDLGAPGWELNIFALTPKWKLVEGLQATDFRVRVNHASLKICSLAHVLLPVSIGIVLDTSRSMASRPNQFELAKAAVDVILNASGPQDEYFLAYANNGASVGPPFTRNLSSIRAGTKVRPRGDTALIDGIYLGISEMRKAHYANRALIVVSDGKDNNSLYRLSDAAAAFGGSSVPVFLLLLANPERLGREEDNDTQARGRLVDFVEKTGGASVLVFGRKHLIEITSELSKLIRSPYTLRLDAAAPPNDLRDLQAEVAGMRPRPLLLYRRLWGTGSPGDRQDSGR